MKPETYAALVSVATAWVDPSRIRQAATTFAAVKDWQELADQAEIHGLSVVLGRFSAAGDIQLPRELDLQLKGLTVRHKKILTARRIVLTELIEIFEQRHIPFAFLKGAALANLIYDPPWLRPMRDIDILVKGSDALKAQKLLRDIQFSNQDSTPGYQFEHHHLPNSIRIQDGFTISLEVHHDALTGDADASIKLDELTRPLRSFNFVGKTAYAFDHEDMLKHLCYHTFEPSEIIKLGSMVDLLRYADHFSDEIDWTALKTSQVKIVNTLACIHALIPLPDALLHKLPVQVDPAWQPAQAGYGFIPLSQIARLSSKKEQFRALFFPSEWWMHIYYVILPAGSLLFTRLFRHPLSIIKWLYRRYRAAGKSRVLRTG